MGYCENSLIYAYCYIVTLFNTLNLIIIISIVYSSIIYRSNRERKKMCHSVTAQVGKE